MIRFENCLCQQGQEKWIGADGMGGPEGRKTLRRLAVMGLTKDQGWEEECGWGEQTGSLRN